MNYDTLIDLVADLGYKLAMSGAETFRIEDSIHRILAAYDVESEAFAITNCIIISIRGSDGRLYNRMRRIAFHGNDLDAVEKYNSLSRRICAEKPSLEVAAQWLKETDASRASYKLPLYLFGSFLAAAGFSVFFGGSGADALCAGLCGLLIGLLDRFLSKFRTNPFFKTIVCAFMMTIAACATGVLGLADNTDAVIIGALMLLVPGLIFTNAMRDIIFGDTNSGINRIVQVILVAAAIASGTAAGWNVAGFLWGDPVIAPALAYGSLVTCLASFIGCAGFFIVFNVRGPGSFLCALGGTAAWAAYCLCLYLGGNELLCYFISAVTAAAYSEIFARIRKSPAIAYLVISLFPLIPGAGIYYTTNHLMMGDMTGFAEQGTHTIAIAGVIAVGILIVSTIMRLWNEWKLNKRKVPKV